jgi:hypothetical protein
VLVWNASVVFTLKSKLSIIFLSNAWKLDFGDFAFSFELRFINSQINVVFGLAGGDCWSILQVYAHYN